MSKPKRKVLLSIDEAALAVIDRMALDAGLSRSEYMVQAVLDARVDRARLRALAGAHHTQLRALADELEAIARWNALAPWVENLGNALAVAGALCRSWSLGRDSCTCDVGPSGNEWRPGMGCSPEAIANRRWNREPHEFVGGGDVCEECGERNRYYLHSERYR
jgi:hypothetical protein